MPKVIHQKFKKPLYIIYGLLSISILSSVFINNTYAENVDYTVTIKPSLSLALSTNEINLTLNPSSSPFDSENVTVSVGTNNPTGYQLYVSTPNDSTNLVEESSSNTYIETLSSSVSEENFTPNRWGYKLDSTSANYSPFASGTLVSSSNGPINTTSKTMSFAAKASYDTAPGTYNLTLSFKTVPKVTQDMMQNLDPTICTEEPTMVMDSRDSQLYAIARLKDGNCWMLQNLKLGKNSDSLVLTTADSDVPSTGFTLTNKSSDGKFTNAGNDNNDNSQYYCTDDYGCYYNWYTATASSGTESTATDLQNVNNSICPAGWTLPTGGNGGEFQILYSQSQYNSFAKMLVSNPTTTTENINGASMPGFLLSGSYHETGATYIANRGIYWSRTASGDSRFAYILTINSGSSGVFTNQYDYKFYGNAVRCVMRTMQNFSPADAAAMNTGDTLSLVDARDSQRYTVAKLADGNVWMTSNLNLAGGTKLYSDDSNVPSGYPKSGGTGYYTLPASSSTGFSDNTVAYVYNTGRETSDQSDCTSTQACNSYYSWLAATAGGKNSSGTSVTSDGGKAPYSVCPKGWKLPSATTDGVSRDSGGYTGGDFYKMILAVTGQSSLLDGYYESTANFYNNAGPGTTPNFLLAGYYSNSQLNDGGSRGLYWPSSSNSSTSAYNLNFNSGYVDSANYGNRRNGFPVRCIKSNS